MQICTGIVACAYNFLTIFSLSSLYLTLSSLSLSLSLSLSRCTTLSFFLSSDQSFFLSSIFLPLASVDCLHCRRRRRWSLFLPLFLVIFGLNGLDQWVSSWMSLAIATACLWRHRSCFLFLPSPPEVSILGGLCGLCCWVCFDSGLLDCVDSGCVDLVAGFVFLVFYRWIVGIPVWYRCDLWVWVGGCMGKEMNILFE